MRQVLGKERSPYPRLVGTALTWVIFTVLCAWGLFGGWAEFGPWGRAALAALTCAFAVPCAGSLVAFLPQGDRCRATAVDGRIVAIESWCLRVEGCDLRRPSDDVFDTDHAPVFAPTMRADERELERWIVDGEGTVVRHRRVMAMLYNLGKDAPRMLGPWADLQPPVRGGAYLIHPGDVVRERD